MNTTKKYEYKHPRPAVTADCVIFGFDEGRLKLLLLERETDPYKNKWALPGGFVSIEETTEQCAKRILQEKTGIKNVFIEQLYTFSEPGRDPRERVMSVAYYALVNNKQFELIAGRDTLNIEWFELSEIPKLAFDHNKIVTMAIQRLKGKISYQPIGFELLEEKFTLPQLQSVYEAILEKEIDRRNFSKKIQETGLLIPLDERVQNVAYRAARYYKFDKKAYKELTKEGFHFEI